MRNLKRAVVGLVVAVAMTVAGMATVEATPSQAQNVTLGVTYFGDANHDGCTGSYCNSDFWRLPSLRAQDLVTVAWVADSFTIMCVTTDVDDFNFAQDMCNASGAWEGDESGMRTEMLVSNASAAAFLTFISQGEPGHPYQFTVETIQSKIGASVPAKTSIKHTRKLQVKPTLTDGSAVPNGVQFTLKIKFGAGSSATKIKRKAVVVDGVATFDLKLAAKYVGKKGRFAVLRGEDAAYQAVRSAEQTIKIK